MTIERRAFVERFLVVLNEDGTFRAAHQEVVDLLIENGKVLHRTTRAAEPLAVEALSKSLPNHAALLADLDQCHRAAAIVHQARFAAEDQVRTLDAAVKDMAARLEAEVAGRLAAEGAAKEARTALAMSEARNLALSGMMEKLTAARGESQHVEEGSVREQAG